MKTNTTTYLVLLASILMSIHSLQAQIVKGTWSLGPDVSYSSSTTEFDDLDFTIKTTDLQLGARLGYYLIDNLEAAIAVGMLSSSTDVEDFESSSSGFSIGPQLHYKVPLSGNFYLPIGGGLRYNSISNEDDNSDEVTYTGMSYYLFTGIEYIVNNKLGAFISIGPEFGKLSDTDSEDEFDVNDFGVGLGFNFYF